MNSEIITNQDGSIYHLGIKPSDVATTIITVGDPHRVSRVSNQFDSVEIKKEKREFVTHTGHLNGHRLTVISTGIGTDNIDIVFNELDALVNYDFEKNRPKDHFSSLRLIRIGTSGAIQPDIKVDSILSSQLAIGLDNLMHYYQRTEQEINLEQLINKTIFQDKINHSVYAYRADSFIPLPADFVEGITLTAPGFYGPQNRQIRLKSRWNSTDWNKLLNYMYDGYKLTNLEMETAGIFGMARELGHRCMSISAILANRHHQTFSTKPQQTIDRMIDRVLQLIIKN